MNYNQLIFKGFKKRGLTITADATLALTSVLSKEDNAEGSLNFILDEIRERIEKQEIKTSHIDVTTITNVVADLTSNEEDLAHESLQLLDAFSSPRIVYEEKQKTFKVVAKPAYSLLGTVESRANMYRERLLLAQQRLLRSGMFKLQGMSVNSTATSRVVDELSTIESLLGAKGTKVLFGMLTQPEEGSWFLEDLGAIIKLDLSKAASYNLFYTEGSIVIVQGEMVNGVFRVSVIGFPPAEDREASMRAIGASDIFGNDTRAKQQAEMLELERTSDSTMIIVISDVQLDKPLVIEKLQKIFEGFENTAVEPLFILMGSFISKPISRTVYGRGAIKAAFSALADVIEKCPRLCKEGKFLLIPGPFDAGSSVAYPRRAIPADLTENIRSRVAHVTFASNPCRVRFYTQEIVLFREDLLKRMQRHLAVPLQLPTGSEQEQEGQAAVPDITAQLVESIMDQSHLFPLPAQAKPVTWDLDYTMRLFPLPHLLVLADHAEKYEYSYQGCNAVNPGSFSSDFSFVVYYPASKTVEFSKIRD